MGAKRGRASWLRAATGHRFSRSLLLWRLSGVEESFQAVVVSVDRTLSQPAQHRSDDSEETSGLAIYVSGHPAVSRTERLDRATNADWKGTLDRVDGDDSIRNVFDHFESGEYATTKESGLLLINGANFHRRGSDPLARHLALLPSGVVGGIGEERKDILRRTLDLPRGGQPHC